MNKKLIFVLVIMVLFALGAVIPAKTQKNGVQSQAELNNRIKKTNPVKYGFVKDLPILGWSITSNRFEDLPEAIRVYLGDVDQTKYTKEYLGKNVGSVVALQMSKTGPDFYIIGKQVFDSKYEIVDVANVINKNSKLIKRLKNAPIILKMLENRNPALVGALKIAPVEMIKLSEIGYAISEQVVIQSPWGEQTKTAGQEGFLVFDESQNQYYMVNQDEDGNPINYVPSK